MTRASVSLKYEGLKGFSSFSMSSRKKEAFPECIAKPRAYFEDVIVVFRHAREIACRLIVMHGSVAKLDARLNDQTDDAFPGAFQPLGKEGFPEDAQCPLDIGGRGDVDRLLRPWDRSLRECCG